MVLFFYHNFVYLIDLFYYQYSYLIKSHDSFIRKIMLWSFAVTHLTMKRMNVQKANV